MLTKFLLHPLNIGGACRSMVTARLSREFKTAQNAESALQVGVEVDAHFISLSLYAMKHLTSCGRSNVDYGLSKGLGSMQQDGKDSVFPAKRVITGLVEYSVNFFNAGDAQM